MTAGDELRAAVSGRQWDAVDRLFNQHFFALLLTEPALVRETLGVLPERWYRDHPRHVMTRGIAAATGPLPLVDADADEAFSTWVASQSQPAVRDQLGVLSARLRARLSLQQFFEADALSDHMLEVIRGAHEHSGFADVLPTALLRIGTAKLLVGKILTASQLFAEAHRWARIGAPHPIDELVQDHLALAAALDEDYVAAARWQGIRGPRTIDEYGFRYHYETVGLVSRALIAVGQADRQAAAVAVRQADDEGARFSELWWVAVHARVRFELFWGDPNAGLSLIRRNRQLRGAQTAPVAVDILRADMADLHMMLGDLAAAKRELGAPDGDTPHPAVQASRVRLELLHGRPEAAAALLSEARAWAELGPTLSVLAAQVEHAARGSASPQAVRRAAFAVHDADARIALLEADRQLFAQLSAAEGDAVLTRVNEYGYRPHLTRRESQILHALRQFDTARDIAAALHVSPNTVKTHLYALYRKLGVHTRDEALRHITE